MSKPAAIGAPASGPARPMTEASRAELEVFLSPDYLRVALTDEARAITLAAQQGLILDDNFLEALKLNKIIGARLEQLAIRQKEQEYANRRQ
jgi:hypothetical protein